VAKIVPEIRPFATPDEARLCARAIASSEPWLTLRFTEEATFQALTDPLREVYVSMFDQEVAGVIVLNLLGPFRGYIQTICVLPNWRNRGIGSELLAHAERRIFREYPNVFLCVSSFNDRAQSLYARLGYQRVGELPDYVVKGHSELLLRKTLGPASDFRPGP
jgi:ribosomal-protein-alanine N-acetyltransferase